MKPAHFAVLTGLLLCACDNKDLCFDHDGHTPRYATNLQVTYDQDWQFPYEGRTDWEHSWPAAFGVDYESLRPGIPEGLRVLAFDSQGRSTRLNTSPWGGEIALYGGTNSLLIYNNDTEDIVFSNMESYATASITTRSRTRASYSGNPLYQPQHAPSSSPTKGENLVKMPDMLYCAYFPEYQQPLTPDPPTLSARMHPVVYTYLVRYEFKEGQQYMALARGALAGMASTVYLHDGHTGPESATLLYDCELKPWGAQAFVRSFGLPDFPGPGYSRGDRSVAINLEVRLTNGKILNFYADVTDQLLAQPWGGVIIVKDLVITPDQGKPDTPGSGGSFDVSVDGWGDFQDIDIPFGS